MTDTTPDVPALSAPEAPDSHLGELRRLHDAIAADRTIDLDVPGYKGRLVGRYRWIPYAQLRGPVLKAQRTMKPEDDVTAAADVIARACESLWYRDTDGSLKPLGDDTEPVVYDQRLCVLLGLKADNARAVVYQVFAGNDNAIMTHAGQLSEWLADTNRQTDEELLGEV